MDYMEKNFGRYTFVYRKPYHAKWYFFRNRAKRIDTVISFWRFAIWRHKGKR